MKPSEDPVIVNTPAVRRQNFRVRAAEAERKTVYVSITEQRGEICPAEILNVFLCDPPPHSLSSAVGLSAALGDDGPLKGRAGREEDDGMGGDGSGSCLPSTQRGPPPRSEVTALQPPAKITAREASTLQKALG